jgi:hypothetical protein
MDESYNTVSTSLGTVSTDIYDYVNGILSNPSIIIIIVIVLVVYVTIFFSLGDSGSSSSSTDSGSSFNLFGSSSSTDGSTDGSSSGSTIIGIIMLAVLLVLMLINGLQYFFGVDIIAKVKNLVTGNPEVDIIIDPAAAVSSVSGVPEIMRTPQVFNIPGNDYVYPDAKALCSAYGARLATYKEIEDAYEGGAEWCNYGWSEGQMALFPTQQKTWDELQKIEGHENDCGRPGVNGGFIENPAVRFGVNCYGHKPQMTPDEEDLMASNPIYPKTYKDIAMENRVKYWKDKLTQILVSPFNHTSWSKI